MAGGKPVVYEEVLPKDGVSRTFITTKFPLHDANGNIDGICGISYDITERVETEKENRHLQEEMLHIQEATLRALSTPLLPITKGVVVLPLIGEITRDRAQRVLDTLLHGISARQARIAILDITGVPSAGTEVVNAIIEAARAVKLIGANIVITGIKPSVAKTLVDLGLDLQGIVTKSTLESGVAWALGR
jgi:anti-anti-sigma regulatory factor